MHAAWLLCWMGVALAGAVPLTSSQREALSTIVDGPDQRDEAFAALIENAQQWTRQNAADEPIRLHPDFKAIIEHPASYRGDLCRIVGSIDQQRRLEAPDERVWERFIRLPDRTPIIVYVVDLNQPQLFRDGDRIEIDARFYKRIDLTARDGVVRAFPAFVGALPTLAGARDGGLGSAKQNPLWILAGPIIVMGIAFAVLMIFVRRRRLAVHSAANRAHAASDAVDESRGLPDDPAEALAELKRRAGQDG
jgi:hypothetical protein